AICGAGAGDEQEIRGRQTRLVEAELFADLAPDAVAHHGVLRDAARHRHAEARGGAVRTVFDREMSRGDAFALRFERSEIRGSQQARRTEQAHEPRTPGLTGSGACGPWRGARSAPGGRRGFSCAHENRAYGRV